MANPQKEDGFTAIANEIMDALCHIRIPGEERQVLDCVLRKTYGWNKCEDAIALTQFTEMTGLKKPTVCRAINRLLSKKIIAVIIEKDNGMGKVYRFNKNYNGWLPLSKKITKGNGLRELIGRKSINEIKNEIITRDYNICQMCGYDGNIANERLLVHHIDFNQGNNNPKNLITVCKSCHGKSHNIIEKDNLSKKIIEIYKKDNPSLSLLSTTKDTTTKDNKTSTVFIFPEWLPQNTFLEYLTMRKTIKRPLSKESYSRFFKSLRKLCDESHGSPEEILNQSIVNSWQGIFALKTGGNNGNKRGNSDGGHRVPPEYISEPRPTDAEFERNQRKIKEITKAITAGSDKIKNE